MNKLTGQDTSNWKFKDWSRYFNKQDQAIKEIMAGDMLLMEGFGPNARESDCHYLAPSAPINSVPPFADAVRLLYECTGYMYATNDREYGMDLSAHAGYLAYQIIRSHELGYGPDRIMGTTLRVWRAFEVAKKVKELAWKKRSAMGSNMEIVKLHSRIERLVEELAGWFTFLCLEHDYDPMSAVGNRH